MNFVSDLKEKFKAIGNSVLALEMKIYWRL